MPKHMQPILSCDVIIDIIALCDSVLYKVNTYISEYLHDVACTLTKPNKFESILQFPLVFVKNSL